MPKYRIPSPMLLAHLQRKRLQKRRMLTESRKNERRFREAIQFLPIPVGISDWRGRVLAHNQMFTDIFGYTIQDIPTIEDWLKLAYPDESYRQHVLAIWQADVDLALERGTYTPARVYDVVCKDGSHRLVEIITQPVGDLLATTFNDVTERKRVEESQRLFKSLVENSSDAIGMSTPEGKHYYQNEAFSLLFGEIGDYPPDTLYVDREVGKQVFETIMAGRQWIGEVKMYARDKSILDILLRAYPIVDEDGKVISLVGIHTNVTMRKQMESALRENEVIFSSFLEHSPVYVFFKDKNIRSLRLSKNYEQMLGMPIQQALGKSMDELFPSELARSMVADDLRILTEGQRVQVIEEFNGRVYETTKFPIFIDGKPDMLAGFTLDITDRVRAEQALRESEARYRALFERANDAIFVEDRNDRIVDVNQRACELLGYTREELLQMRVPDLIAPEMGRRRRAIEEEFTLYGGKPFESLDVRKDGARVPVEVTNASLPNGLALSIVRDITGRKQIEAALRESERRFRILFEHAGVGVAQVDSITGQFIQVNQKYCDIVGYTRQEMQRLDFQSITHPDDLQADLDLMERLKEGQIPEFTLEKRYYRKDGSLVWVHLIVSPLWRPGQPPDTHIAVVHDITERKRAEDELRESEKRFRVLFENAGVGVAQGDTNTGRFLKVNQKYGDILGYTRQEMESIDFPSITYPDDLQKNLDLLEQLKRGEIPEFTMEKRYIRKDGTLVWVLLTVSPLWNPGEPPSTHITVVHDITDQKRVEYALRYSEAEIRKLNAELERRVAERTLQLEVANKELEAFAYSVSHDLRAPLRAIDGFSRILVNEYAGELSAEARGLIDKVRSANSNMSQLVDALLGLSRMTRAEIRREPIDLSPLARNILEALSREQPEREVEWRVADQAIADGDSRLLRVVLENLLGNAWKFTSKKERARIEFGIEKRNGETIYLVRDNGAGFNPRYADKLFGAFQRLHRSDEFEGTGIGLATVQRIIHRHGGRIWAESELGKGATFYFTLG